MSLRTSVYLDPGDTNQESKPGRPARYRIGPDGLPEDKPALPAELPDEACTPPEVAHLSPQVSEGCAAVQAVQGGTSGTCTVCGEPLDQALVNAGFTDHGEEVSR